MRGGGFGVCHPDCLSFARRVSVLLHTTHERRSVYPGVASLFFVFFLLMATLIPFRFFAACSVAFRSAIGVAKG